MPKHGFWTSIGLGSYYDTVHLCPAFFNGGIPKGRALIHEWSHIWNNTADTGYVDSESQLEDDGLPSVPNTDAGVPIAGEQALGNADSVSLYAWYGF